MYLTKNCIPPLPISWSFDTGDAAALTTTCSLTFGTIFFVVGSLHQFVVRIVSTARWWWCVRSGNPKPCGLPLPFLPAFTLRAWPCISCPTTCVERHEVKCVCLCVWAKVMPLRMGRSQWCTFMPPLGISNGYVEANKDELMRKTKWRRKKMGNSTSEDVYKNCPWSD